MLKLLAGSPLAAFQEEYLKLDPLGDTSAPPLSKLARHQFHARTGLPNRAKPKIKLFFLQNQFELEMVLQTRNGFARRNKTILRLKSVEIRKMVCQTVLRTKWFGKKKQYNIRFCTIWQTSLQHQHLLTPKKSSINSGLTNDKPCGK